MGQDEIARVGNRAGAKVVRGTGIDVVSIPNKQFCFAYCEVE
jgi:hypothetical protein